MIDVELGQHDVSRETLDNLKIYVSLIEKWNPRINLVSKTSLSHIWTRHIWDSAQLFEIVDKGKLWADLGSGGGLPAIVLAILAKETRPELDFHLIESDQRKCAFLRTCIREIGLNAMVTTVRIEKLHPMTADIVSARALADLEGLLAFSERHLKEGGISIFPKGETWKKEIADAEENWSFEYEEIKSNTNPNAAILKIWNIERV